MKRIVRIGLSFVAAVGALACGGKADSGAAGGEGETASATASATTAGAKTTDRDPCALFTEAQMGEVIGTTVTRHETQSSRCIYYTADPNVYVDLEVNRSDADAMWKGVNAGNAAIGAAQDSLAGIGDQAFFGPRDRLYARKGGTFVAVEAGFDAKERDRARKVARAALDRAE